MAAWVPTLFDPFFGDEYRYKLWLASANFRDHKDATLLATTETGDLKTTTTSDLRYDNLDGIAFINDRKLITGTTADLLFNLDDGFCILNDKRITTTLPIPF